MFVLTTLVYVFAFVFVSAKLNYFTHVTPELPTSSQFETCEFLMVRNSLCSDSNGHNNGKGRPVSEKIDPRLDSPIHAMTIKNMPNVIIERGYFYTLLLAGCSRCFAFLLPSVPPENSQVLILSLPMQKQKSKQSQSQQPTT